MRVSSAEAFEARKSLLEGRISKRSKNSPPGSMIEHSDLLESEERCLGTRQGKIA